MLFFSNHVDFTFPIFDETKLPITGALSLDEVVEMLVDELPFLVFVVTHLFEVSEEVGFLFGLIQETKLFVDERLHSDATDSLCLVQHIVVELPLHLVFGMGVNVDTEVFPAAHLHRFGVADCRIIIQIQGDTIIPNRSLTNCYFCTCV